MGVVQHLDEIRVVLDLAVVLVVRFVMRMEPPLGIDRDEYDVVGEVDFLGSRAATLRQPDILHVRMFLNKFLPAPDIFKPVFSALFPIVVAGDKDHSAGVRLRGIDLGFEVTFIVGAAGIVFVTQPHRVEVIAQERDRTVSIGGLELPVEHGHDTITVFRFSGITDKKK